MSTPAPDRGPAGEPRYRPAGEAYPRVISGKPYGRRSANRIEKTNIGEAGRCLRSRIALSAIEHLEQIANQYPLRGEIARAEIATVRAFNQRADEKMPEQALARLWILAAVPTSFFVSLVLIRLLRPWLAHYALAHPNTRSSHQVPTPQGGGAAVIIATLSVGWGAIMLVPGLMQEQRAELLATTAGTMLLAAVGFLDDMRTLRARSRLVMQCIAVAAIVAVLPADWQIVPPLPRWAERGCLFLGGLWFVNLVNFMDGIDWMTVAEFVPALGAVTLIGLAGEIEFAATVLAAALLGAILGFAPFNKPVAWIFLGDVGSLPMGLLLGWLLLQLAEKGHLAAALILPLYYLADASITLARRVAAGEEFWRAHRKHFYQRAIDRGLGVLQVVGRVFGANLALAALALSAVALPKLGWMALAAAGGIVTWLLASLACGRR